LGVALGELRKFTLEQLKQYNGQNGRPAYIAYKGKVYDVTDNYTWGDGKHYGEHQAGQDVTGGMPDAPHGEDKLEVTVLIGELIK
jgi:predicted heme/steroid binding protein